MERRRIERHGEVRGGKVGRDEREKPRRGRFGRKLDRGEGTDSARKMKIKIKAKRVRVGERGKGEEKKRKEKRRPAVRGYAKAPRGAGRYGT